MTVYTQPEFRKALENRERTILVKGELAREMRRKHNIKRTSRVCSYLLTTAGLAAIPFTGGASSGLTAAGLALAATSTTLTISATELAILCGCAIALFGISHGAKIVFNKDGSVTVEPKY